MITPIPGYLGQPQILTKALTLGALNHEDLDDAGEAVKSIVKGTSDAAGDILGGVISERLQNANKEKDALESFRENLKQLVQSANDSSGTDEKPTPLVIIVDELDRCRPPFALSILERIKHLFSVPGVHFLLVTHLPHLEQTVQGAYGLQRSQEYLEKFYQLRIRLPKPENPNEDQTMIYIRHLWDVLGIQLHQAGSDYSFCSDLSTLATAHNLQLRTLERILSNLALFAASQRGNDILIPGIIPALAVMRHIRPDDFEKALNGTLNWTTVEQFLSPDGKSCVNGGVLEWWKLVSGEPLPEDRRDKLAQSIAEHTSRPQNLLPIIASQFQAFSRAGTASSNLE